MKKDVLICVKGLQMLDAQGDEEPIEIIVPGEYYFRGGSHYLRYEEILDDSGQLTTNYVKMSQDAMEVRKKGLVNVHMVFELGKKNMAYYTTPYGTIQMGIAATGLEFHEEEAFVCMRAEYALDVNEQHVADCCLEIQAREKNPESTAEDQDPFFLRDRGRQEDGPFF
ncbi:MAG: DUF1934 domain-containing protein [Blautia sp.]|nr:DUF1934 domain-containing protein [Blautia sp.]